MKRVATTWLVLRASGTGARVVRHAARQPRLSHGEVAVRVSVAVDDVAFTPVVRVSEPVTFDTGDVLRATVSEAKP